jgi:acetyltransferase-like isoleucine patch superfamily enzyme
VEEVKMKKKSLRFILNKFLLTSVKFLFPIALRIASLRATGAKVGKDVYIGGGFTLIGLGKEHKLTIEDRVTIAVNVTIILASSPNKSKLYEYVKEYPFIEVLAKKGVIIKNNAWIGTGAIIMPNITVGEFSIIGAGSVVTKNVPPYTVVAGVPAKVIRTLKASNK